MKIIPKGLYGLITLSDNTRIAKPIILERIPYKLKPNELYFIDKKTGKKTLVKRKLEIISEDKRNKYLRLLDWNRTKQILKLLEQDKNYEKGIETINSLTKLTLPSTYIGPLLNNNGKSYTDNLISGEGTGNTVGNAAIDLLIPFAIGGAKSLATRLFPKSITVYKGGTKPFTQDYTFFTTDKEYAKLFGPVLKYKLKYRHPAYTEDPLTYKNMEGIHFYIDDNLRLLNKPLSDIIIGHDALTNEGLIPSKGTEYVVWNPEQIKVTSKTGGLRRFASFDLSSPLKNGLWDTSVITLLVKEGGQKAVDFLGSQTRLNTYNYNRNLANRLGFGGIEEPYNSIARVRKPFKVKFNTNTLSNEGGSFIPGKTALLDIVEINLTHDIEPAAFHETLHRGSYGMGSLEGLDNMSEFRNTNRFYEYLSDKLKKPWSELPTSMRDYLDKPGELPVNVLELGLRMGIQVGLKYPGKTKFNTIIDLFKRNNPNDGKLFILDYLNMDKPKRVWDALSGLYFTTLPAIYGGYKATEE